MTAGNVVSRHFDSLLVKARAPGGFNLRGLAEVVRPAPGPKAAARGVGAR
jgi:hypothetical protein